MKNDGARIQEYFEKEPEGVALGMTLECLFNRFGSDKTAEDMADYLCRYCHHTIQQSIMRGVVIFLRKMAATEYYDDRNESSVKAARTMIEAYDNARHSLPFI